MKLLLCFSLLQAQHFIKFSTDKLSNNQRIAFSFNFKELKQRICIDLGMKFLLIGLHYRWDFQICLKDLHLQLLHFFFFFFNVNQAQKYCKVLSKLQMERNDSMQNARTRYLYERGSSWNLTVEVLLSLFLLYLQGKA